MAWRTDLLTPIAGSNPAGQDLRYDPTYDKIKEARREEDEAPQGDWARARKVADHQLVAKLAGDALATKSKDLQLAAWLTEAMVRREGFSGLKGGVEFITALLETFWDNVFPELEDGDAELRAAPLEWLGLMDLAIKSVPLNRGGHDYFKFQSGQKFGYESAAGGDYYKLETRKKATEAGQFTPEEFDRSFGETPKAWYKSLIADLDGSLAALEKLGAVSDEKFGSAAPSYITLRKALEEVRQTAFPLLQKKLELEPDPPELAAEVAGDTAAAGDAPRRSTAGEPVDREDAVARIVDAARYLRHKEPHNPASYLLLRGLRWGETRASGSAPSPKLFEAPSLAVRTQLRTLSLDGLWPDLLEAAENAMGQPCGRGWLDLQRYAVRACQSLGQEYYWVEAGIRGALRSLLAEVPGLIGMTMMDDTPTANEETRTWLESEVLPGPEAQAGSEPAEGTADEPAEPRGVDPAMEAARSGRTQHAIELLMRDLARERSARGRFRRKTQLGKILVAAGQEAIAKPILEELAAQIEVHKLEEWESGEVVAEPLVLLYQCMYKLDGDTPERQALYLRICRLDPVQAIQCAAVANG